MKSAVNILGVPFSSLSFDETIALIRDWMGGSEPRQIVTANPEIVMLARRDPDFLKLLQQADLVTPDGIGIVYAAKILEKASVDRVTGIDILPFLFETANQSKWPVYLLGASPESNRRAIENLSRLYPNALFKGRDGFFSDQEIPSILEEIRSFTPRLLLVGLGLGKQEKFIARYLKQLHVPVSIGVGGCIDIYAGTVRRAPLVWRKLQLEWLYRLLKQPSRWRRQLVLPHFAWIVIRKRLRL
ncbi:WecB/TagA/CpsF family glycosyltransferase [Effusibacillus dendaii]|uniref:N-acetylglucosaminyldiphosphoundecaprenol N-acetyl-beta-D-mannosaminyltransferase n=1 Tax=Effusibacillus dendaii TaxID=2743772 RepID=A0A7I8DGY3_9BACL|nr:WecB/TagA/CpsF family glycosyltransferase [Effusibacillus dendaii]BCJ87840.1 acetylglucosaminyldiphosphoundecaprenol acetyl-beta-D-mannosaminyltransferase [Effusibacillus dendaii]